MATLLKILQTENVKVDASSVSWGPNTHSGQFNPENWHMRFDSTGTDASMASLSLSDESSFLDVDSYDREYNEPEYAVVPWAAHGSCLTIKLALGCLSMMAMTDASLGEEYPPLDSWTSLEKGARLWEPFGAPQGLGSEQEEARQQRSSVGSYEEQVSMQDETQDVIYVAEGDEGQFQDEGGEGAETPRAGSSVQRSLSPATESDISHGKRKVRIVKLTKVGRGKYTFTNSKGKLVQTTKAQWEKVDGGYEFSGERHVYFTEKLP